MNESLSAGRIGVIAVRSTVAIGLARPDAGLLPLALRFLCLLLFKVFPGVNRGTPLRSRLRRGHWAQILSTNPGFKMDFCRSTAAATTAPVRVSGLGNSGMVQVSFSNRR
jgi:hypothetical protein